LLSTRDAIYTLRLWRRNPGSTLAAILALTLGIAGTTAIFAVINALLFQPLPVRQPETLVSLFTTDRQHDDSQLSMPDALDLKHRLHSAAGFAIFCRQLFNMSAGGQTTLVHALAADPALFSLLGLPPVKSDNSSALVLSWPFWQSHFNGKPVIGQTIRLDNRAYVIAGILPKALDLPFPADLWLPLEFDLAKPENARAIHRYSAWARLAPGVTLAQFTAGLSVLTSQLALENPSEDKGVTFHAIGLRGAIAGDVKIPLLLLLAAVTAVLLMACANVANLLLARSAARLREVSVRMAVGASRLQLFFQFLVESLLLAAISAAAALVLAAFAVHVLRLLPDTHIPRPETISIDWRVLLFAIATAALTALLFGILPALQASRAPLTEILKQTAGRAALPPRSHRARHLLLTAETAIATTLLIASILLVQSFRNVIRLNPGFQTDHLLTMYLSLPDSRYGSDSIYAARFADQALALIQAIPGVTQAALSKNLPLNPGGDGPIQIEGRPAPAHIWETPFVIFENVTPGFRRTLQIPLLRGRDFDDREDLPGAKGILISQSVARQYFPGVDPIGKRIAYKFTPGKAPSEADWHKIVGVIGDTQRDFRPWAFPAIYIPIYRAANNYPALIVRTEGDPSRYAKAIQDAIHKVDPEVPCFLIQTMDEVIRGQLGWRAFNTSLLSLFAAAALLLATIGVFSVVSYSVAQRSSEIGLRIACGASQRDIFLLILKQGTAPAATGIAIGMLAAFLLGRYLQSELMGITLRHPLPYAVAALFLLFTATAASLLPARRAASTDPWTALRYE
jgi:putative ABC transport system permease protein